MKHLTYAFLTLAAMSVPAAAQFQGSYEQYRSPCRKVSPEQVQSECTTGTGSPRDANVCIGRRMAKPPCAGVK